MATLKERLANALETSQLLTLVPPFVLVSFKAPGSDIPDKEAKDFITPLNNKLKKMDPPIIIRTVNNDQNNLSGLELVINPSKYIKEEPLSFKEQVQGISLVLNELYSQKMMDLETAQDLLTKFINNSRIPSEEEKKQLIGQYVAYIEKLPTPKSLFEQVAEKTTHFFKTGKFTEKDLKKLSEEVIEKISEKEQKPKP